MGVDDLITQAADERPEPDAFAHLYRDQQSYEGRHPAPAPMGPPVAGTAPGPEAVPHQPAPEPEPAPVAAAGKPSGGRASGLLKSSAVMAAGTMVSRLTGFVRSALIVAALGGAVLGDSWQVAYQLPTMIFILTIGGGLNSVFVPQLVRAMKEDDDGGEAYANRLLTLVIVILGALTVLAVLAAPLLVKLVSFDISRDPAANEVAVAFTRYCVPTIFFMGLHVVMGQILNARGRFGAMMWTPVLNNIVMIATFGLFIWVYGTAKTSHIGVTTIPDEGIRLLGIGTLLGLVVQALAMIPYLRDADFKLRLRFDWRGHGLGKAAKLAKWTVLFVLANQAGVLVVTQLSTWAGNTANDQGHPGTGFISYASAQLIWNMPQAIITVSVMAALLPRLARSAHDGDTGAVRDDMSQGLRTSAVAIVPISFGFLSLGIPLCTLVYGSSGAGIPMGYMLMALRCGADPVLGAVRRPARLLRVRGHPHPLLQHGDRRRRQRRGLRSLLPGPARPVGRGRHGGLLRPGVHHRRGRGLAPSEQAHGRRPRHRSCRPDLRTAGGRQHPGHDHLGRRGVRDHADARQRVPRVAGRSGRRLGRTSGRVLRSCTQNAH